MAYASLGFYAYLQASLGPAMSLLRAELNLNYTLTALHLSAFAIGMIIVGIFGEKIASRLGRYKTFWLGGAGMAFGTILLALGQNPILTILGSFAMGLLGSNLLIMIQASLADQFGEKRAIALTESNVVAVIFASLVPTLLVLGQQFFGNWRLAWWAGIAFWLLMYGFGRKLLIPSSRQIKTDSVTPHQKLPRIFWFYWLVMFLGVAIEWCLVFWTPDFLAQHVQFSAETATLLMTAFYVAMIVGRIIGTWLSHRFPALHLLLGAQILSLVSFPLLWLSPHPIGNIIGLVLMGAGIANFFPLCLAVISEIGQDQADKASARVSQASGSAILILPLVLGNLADNTGIFWAYGIGLILLILLPIIVFLALRTASKTKITA